MFSITAYYYLNGYHEYFNCMLILHHKIIRQKNILPTNLSSEINLNSIYTKVSLCFVFKSTKSYSSQQRINHE